MNAHEQNYTLWIEAECWVPGSWTAEDTDTDVILTWENGERWVGSFITYKHIQTITEKFKRTGECLSGSYFWMSDMILIDIATRDRIKEVIDDLLEEEIFTTVFSFIPPREDGEDEE